VDREAERDALWGALAEAAERDEPRLVLLSGPAGCGKSRLADWLCERAQEVGGATVLQMGLSHYYRDPEMDLKTVALAVVVMAELGRPVAVRCGPRTADLRPGGRLTR